MERYFGTYQTFQTASKKEAADLIGADNLVGDLYRIECTIEDGEQKAWLVNKFDRRIGFFDPSFSRELSIMHAQGMKLVALLSFVAFTDHPEPGHYWGEAAVVAFDPSLQEAVDPFITQVAGSLKKAVRPVVDLQGSAIDHMVSSQGNWLPKDTVPFPAAEKGTAILKNHQSITDRLVEETRKGNKGCYIASWAVLLSLVAAALFGMKSCGLF